MLIAFYSHGRRAGKDTAGKFVAQWAAENHLSYQRRGFADKGKLLVAETLGIHEPSNEATIAVIDVFKTSGGLKYWLTSNRQRPHGREIAGRDFIINLLGPLGEDEPGGARKLFGESFWTKQALPDNWRPEADITCFTDLRSDDEAKQVHHHGGRVIEIVNPRAESAGGRSERGISDRLISTTIFNTGTLEDFDTAIRSIVSILYAREP